MSKRLTSAHIWKPAESVEANARTVLPAMVREYFAAGRKVVDSEAKPSALHPFRLATKRIRYTLEIFRDLYGVSLDGRLNELKPVQDALGDVNDCVATRDDFDAGKKFRKYLAKRGTKKAKKFFRVWKEQFDTPGKEEMWIEFLAHVPESQMEEPKAPRPRRAPLAVIR